MCGSGRGFKIARALNEFVNTEHMQEAEFSILPLHGSGNNICNTMDTPGSREDIERYYPHEVKANNANGKIRTRESMALGALKIRNSPFRNYLDGNRIYINNAKLGEEEGLSLRWIFKAHPAFGFRDDIKERLIAMMTKDETEIKLALFPKNIKYKRVNDGKVVSTTGGTLQVAKTEGVTATEFRANMAEKWQQLDAKKGVSLWQ
jgi:hypothetical protein